MRDLQPYEQHTAQLGASGLLLNGTANYGQACITSSMGPWLSCCTTTTAHSRTHSCCAGHWQPIPHIARDGQLIPHVLLPLLPQAPHGSLEFSAACAAACVSIGSGSHGNNGRIWTCVQVVQPRSMTGKG